MKKKKPVTLKRKKPLSSGRSDFGERLYQARRDRGLTQKEVAKGAGLSERMIVRYEQTALPHVKSLEKIAHFLKVSVNHLLSSKVIEVPEDIRMTLAVRRHVAILKKFPEKYKKQVFDLITSIQAMKLQAQKKKIAKKALAKKAILQKIQNRPKKPKKS